MDPLLGLIMLIITAGLKQKKKKCFLNQDGVCELRKEVAACYLVLVRDSFVHNLGFCTSRSHIDGATEK